MPKQSPDLTRDLFQAFLDHFWSAAAANSPASKLTPAGYLISYNSLIQRAAVVAEARRLGGPLTEIAELCRLKGWPPMAALVVRQDVGQPGVGYFRRPKAPTLDFVTDAHLKEWETDARACIDFPQMPRTAPALTAKAPKRLVRPKPERP